MWETQAVKNSAAVEKGLLRWRRGADGAGPVGGAGDGPDLGEAEGAELDLDEVMTV